jgi:hypothetical protein
MSVLLRWLFRLVSLAVVLSVATVAVAGWIASRSIPDYEADWTVDGITAPVEIVRNTSAVPHIFGETDADVFFGLGIAHAQDRLWQMLMLRRTAQGRLSELFGPATAQIDDLLRRLDLDGYATCLGRRAGARDAGRAGGLCGWRQRVDRHRRRGGAGPWRAGACCCSSPRSRRGGPRIPWPSRW